MRIARIAKAYVPALTGDRSPATCDHCGRKLEALALVDTSGQTWGRRCYNTAASGILGRSKAAQLARRAKKWPRNLWPTGVVIGFRLDHRGNPQRRGGGALTVCAWREGGARDQNAPTLACATGLDSAALFSTVQVEATQFLASVSKNLDRLRAIQVEGAKTSPSQYDPAKIADNSVWPCITVESEQPPSD